MIYGNLRQFGYAGKRLPGQPAAEAGLRRALLSIAARPAREGRARDGDRAGGRRRRRAAGRGSRRRDNRPPSMPPRWATATTRNSKKRGAWLKEFLGTQQAADLRAQLHGRVQLPRAPVRLSQHRTRPRAGRLGRLRLPVGRHAAVLACAPAPTAACASPTASPSGNEADLDLADYLNFLVDDPETRQIVLFIEGIRRPDAFMAAAGRALEAGKPVLAIKTGATAKSRAAAQSHTGAIGGDYAAYLAMCDRYGICNFRSLDDLVEAALAFQGGRLPKGPRVGFVTTSGGTVDLLYDYAESDGVGDPRLHAGDRQGAAALHAGEASSRRTRSTSASPRRCRTQPTCARSCRRIRTSTWWRGPPCCRTRSGAWDGVEALHHHAGAHRQAGDRLWPHELPDARRRWWRRRRPPAFPFLQGLRADRARHERALASRRAARPQGRLAAAAPSLRRLRRRRLTPTLAALGIALPKSRAGGNRGRSCRSSRGDRLSGGAENPVAGHPAQDRGRRRRARSAQRQGRAAAADTLLASARKAKPDARIDGFLVQEMVSGIEAIVGALNDPLYGPLLLVGAGGILVELAKDSALQLLPVEAGEVTAMVAVTQAQSPARRLSRQAGGGPRRIREDRARAGAILSRSSFQDCRDRDQPADGAP